MKIQLSKLRSVKLFKGSGKITQKSLWFIGWHYWYIRVPLTDYFIHYEKRPF